MNGWVVLLWSFVSALVLIVIGIFIALVMMGRIALFPSAAETIEPTPEATGVIDTTYSVLVLNATAEEGLDVQVRDTLLNNGWAGDAVNYGDAGQQDFETTTVYYVAEADEQAAIGLADLIGGADVAQSDFYADASNPDEKKLVVVIGLDRTATGGESTEAPSE